MTALTESWSLKQGTRECPKRVPEIPKKKQKKRKREENERKEKGKTKNLPTETLQTDQHRFSQLICGLKCMACCFMSVG